MTRLDNNMLILTVIFAAMVSGVRADAQSKKNFELNTVMMKSTFEVVGHNARGQSVEGTAFLMGRPIPKEPTELRYVLVTAAHVFAQMQGELAVLDLRRKKESGEWVRLPLSIRIRSGSRPLWTKSPDADVAVMYIAVPRVAKVQVLSTNLLADDSMLSKFDIHPGDELECLGYPFGASANPAGFPILRSGKIASYPLLPTDKIKTFLFDFKVFPGNSGGPVYFVQTDRIYGGVQHLGTVHFIVGLVTQQEFALQAFREQNGTRVIPHPLDLGVVVDASLIRKAIALLPPPGNVPSN